MLLSEDTLVPRQTLAKTDFTGSDYSQLHPKAAQMGSQILSRMSAIARIETCSSKGDFCCYIGQ